MAVFYFSVLVSLIITLIALDHQRPWWLAAVAFFLSAIATGFLSIEYHEYLARVYEIELPPINPAILEDWRFKYVQIAGHAWRAMPGIIVGTGAGIAIQLIYRRLDERGGNIKDHHRQ